MPACLRNWLNALSESKWIKRDAAVSPASLHKCRACHGAAVKRKKQIRSKPYAPLVVAQRRAMEWSDEMRSFQEPPTYETFHALLPAHILRELPA